MIEKLKKQNTWGECLEKLNELVDAVNGILAAQEQYTTIYNEDIVPMLTPKNEEPADPYAEQRKWVGCLVRYKICDFQGGWNTDVLDEIRDHPLYPFVMRNGDTAQVCEVVEPNEIYPNKARTW